MWKLWYVSLLVFAALFWRPTYAVTEICNNFNVFMYCNCEPASRNQITVTCFITATPDPSSELWASFSGVERAVAFTLNSRHPIELNFVPVEALKNLPDLESLTIQESNLGPLKVGTIANMTNLIDVRLERNGITDLDRYSIANLPQLKKLTLSENSLTEILADSLVELISLEGLFLDRNNISRIETCAFCNLHSLKELELWENRITDLTEHTFRGLRYVNRLELQHNQLRILNDKVFQSMPRLKELDLKDNFIDHISSRAFYGLENLQLLHLRNNQLKNLPDHLFQFSPKLMFVDLSFNSLETLRLVTLKSLSNIKSEHFTLMFKENPLQCGCGLKWISHYIDKTKSHGFHRELEKVECLTTTGEKEEAHSMQYKDCDHHHTTKKITTRTGPETPTMSTPSSLSIGPAHLNPKYQPDTSENTIRTTEHSSTGTTMSSYEHGERHDNGSGSVSSNIAQLFYIVLIALFLNIQHL